jgi:tetratricopeptide (TPR) repeat protein
MKLIIKAVIILLVVFPTLIAELTSFIMLENRSGLNFSIFAEEVKKPRKTRKTPAMRERIYSQLARAQTLSDEGQISEGIAVLDKLKSRSNQINSYEKAMMWNFYGFIYYSQNDIKSAIHAFEQVTAQENIPESLELSTLFSLAQLSMAIENYDQTIFFIDQWQTVKKGDLSESLHVLKSNSYYAMKDYQQSLKSISSAIESYNGKNKIPKENWLVLKRALHYELKQTNEVTDVSEQLVRHYSKGKYWLELANMYGEAGKDEQQLAMMEAAYQQGYVTKSTDIKSLAQLYYFSGAPYKSASLLEIALRDNVVTEEPKLLNFLAQSWITSKEKEKAVPVLVRAADMTIDGNVDARLSELLIDLERWSDVLKYTSRATKKGMLDNPGNVFVASGIAYFNLKNYPAAIEQFTLAKDQKRQTRIAAQWLAFAERESQNQSKSRNIRPLGD